MGACLASLSFSRSILGSMFAAAMHSFPAAIKRTVVLLYMAIAFNTYRQLHIYLHDELMLQLLVCMPARCKPEPALGSGQLYLWI